MALGMLYWGEKKTSTHSGHRKSSVVAGSDITGGGELLRKTIQQKFCMLRLSPEFLFCCEDPPLQRENGGDSGVFGAGL